MAPKTALETVDGLLRDIMRDPSSPHDDEKPFGGKIMKLGGHFRQVLPVVERGTRADIVQASLKNSRLWKQFRIFKLRGNMRLNLTPKNTVPHRGPNIPPFRCVGFFLCFFRDCHSRLHSPIIRRQRTR